MSKNLFNEIITDKQSWKKCYYSKEIFMPLLKYICETNHIKFAEPQKTAGTTVFRVGDTIIKLFNPLEFKFKDVYAEYNTELEAMKFCKSLGVLTPDVICDGIIYDKYSFPYIVTGYIDGIASPEVLDNCNKSEKTEFYLKLKEIADKIHVPTNINIPRYDDSKIINHELWNIMPESFREDRKNYLSSVKIPAPVFVHGDLGHRNIIIDKRGRLNLIDFADGIIAPYYLEYKYYLGDEIIKELCFGDCTKDELYEIFTIVCLIDYYGAELIKIRANDLSIDFSSITSVNALRDLIIKKLNKK